MVINHLVKTEKLRDENGTGILKMLFPLTTNMNLIKNWI